MGDPLDDVIKLCVAIEQARKELRAVEIRVRERRRSLKLLEEQLRTLLA